MIELRPYQVAAVDKLRDNLRKGIKRQILSSATGSGKTEMAMAVMRGVVEKGSKAAFIADRRPLVEQTSQRMWNAGIEHGILMGNDTFGVGQRVRVCSAQTIESRGMHECDLVVIDECHELRDGLLEMVARLDVPVIGLTATPFPHKLAKYYDEIVNVTTTSHLIADNFLCPIKIVSPETQVDIEGLKVSAGGEWSQRDIGKRILRIVGDIVPEWERQCKSFFGGPEPTIAFAASIDDAEALASTFQSAGYDFGVVSSRTPERNPDIIRKYRQGNLMGLVNCAVLSRGFDAPHTHVLVDAYPLRSSLLTLIQRLGRVMRVYPEKPFGLVIDHSENWLAFRDQIMDFYENGPGPLGESRHAKGERKPVDRVRATCRQCRKVFDKGDEKCSQCGTERLRRQEVSQLGKYPVVDGKLQLIDEVTGVTSSYGQLGLWREICTVTKAQSDDADRAHKRATMTYKSITGKWPPTRDFQPLSKEPDKVVRDMVLRDLRAYMIRQKFARAKSREG